MTKRAAIILAGGKSSRFQMQNEMWQDKVLALLGGKPLLVHVIENIQKEVDETIVVVNEEQRRTAYSELLEKHGISQIKTIIDAKTRTSGGPLIAIFTGLKTSTADYCLTVPSDMPLLNPKVAKYLFNELNGSYVAVPMWPKGELETLLMVLDRKVSYEIAEVLCSLGRSRPDDIIRGALQTLFVAPQGKIKQLDPELKSFVNINRQQDLSQLATRQNIGSQTKDLRLNLGQPPFMEFKKLLEASDKLNNANFMEASEAFGELAVVLDSDLFFWTALTYEYQAKSIILGSKKSVDEKSIQEAKNAFFKAQQNYDAEAKSYEKNSCFRLAERAKSDEIWCELQMKVLGN